MKSGNMKRFLDNIEFSCILDVTEESKPWL
jgi:hypothetical protein